MADRQAINDLFADYAWAMDARDFDLLAQVFHDDASFIIYIEGADPVGPFEPGLRESWSSSARRRRGRPTGAVT